MRNRINAIALLLVVKKEEVGVIVAIREDVKAFNLSRLLSANLISAVSHKFQ